MKKVIILAVALSLSLSSQNPNELLELKNQLTLKFWEVKEKNLKSQERLKNELTLLEESIKNANERRNNLVEEFYLLQENLSTIQENLSQKENERNSLITSLDEMVLEEKNKLKTAFPIMIERNTPKLNAIERNNYNPLEKAQAILSYKNNLIQDSETLELYQQNIENPENNELSEVNVLRVGFIGSLFSDNNDFVGFLIRKTGIGGIGYEWETNIPYNKKNAIATSVTSAINNLGKDELSEIALDPVQAGEKLKSFLSQNNLTIFQSARNFIAAGGIIMYPLLLLGLVAFFIIIERLFFYRRYNFTKNKEFFRYLDTLNFSSLNESKITSFNLTKQKPLTNFIEKIISIKKKDPEELESAAEEKITSLENTLNSKITTLAVLGTIAPLLGLLGTVSGMISLFDVITIYGTSNPKILAGGISIALITTQTGLSLAIPILLFHHYLVRKKTRIINFLEEKTIAIIEFKKSQLRETTREETTTEKLS